MITWKRWSRSGSTSRRFAKLRDGFASLDPAPTRTDLAPVKKTGRCRQFKAGLAVDCLGAGLLEIGQNLGEGVPANVAKHRVVRRVCGSPQPDVQRPGASPRPGCIINGQRAAEDITRISRQVCPGHHEVACWVAHSEKAEIDDSAELLALDQQVGRMKIAVHPDRLACPRRCRQSCLPYPQQWPDIETVLQNCSRRSGVVIVSGE